jgi:flagellar biosynthesis GTPase FlhF
VDAAIRDLESCIGRQANPEDDRKAEKKIENIRRKAFECGVWSDADHPGERPPDKLSTKELFATHYRKVDVLGRGWTRDLIDQYLGRPELTTPGRSNLICWYDKGRVHKTEQRADVMEDLALAQERKAAWVAGEPERQKRRQEKWAAEYKKEKLLREQEREKKREDARAVERSVSQEIRVKAIEQPDLEQQAAASYYRSIECRETRLVAFARHKLSNYETLLKLYDTEGHRWRYGVIKRLVLKAIGQTYPWLAAECERQVRGIESSVKEWVWHRAY